MLCLIILGIVGSFIEFLKVIKSCQVTMKRTMITGDKENPSFIIDEGFPDG